MGVLSAIPKGVVLAMQIALAALVVLAVVPIAAGGMQIDDLRSDLPEYENGVISVNAKATVTTDLYFDITGFGYDVSIVSGGNRITFAEEPGMTIPKKGSTDIDVQVEIPLTTVIMMLLLGVFSEDQQAKIELKIGGSTLGGMISVSAEMDVFAPNIVDVTECEIDMTPDGNDIEYMGLKFRIKILSDIIDLIPDLNAKINIGGTEIIFSKAKVPDPGKESERDIALSWAAGPGEGILESIEAAVAAGGGDGIDITYDDGSGPQDIHLTKEQADLIVDILKMIMGVIR